jgi:FecR protein
MKRNSKISARTLTTATLLGLSCLVAAESSKKEARVTRIIREVNLLPEEAKPRPASLNDQVREGTAVRTGEESKSELTFLDLTITRLGANSIFSFNKAGRDVDLSSGSVLLRVPKDSGGATIRTSGVTAGVAGTTVILEAPRSGRNKLIVLEGLSRLTLRKYSDQSKLVHAGEMLDVPPGARTLPDPVKIDIQQVMRTHPLIKDFAQLPSAPLIVDEIQKQHAPGYVSAPHPPPLLTGAPIPTPRRPPANPPTGPVPGGPRPGSGGSSGETGPTRPPRPGHPVVGQPGGTTGTVGTGGKVTPTPPPVITKTSPTQPTQTNTPPSLNPLRSMLGGSASAQAQPTRSPRFPFKSFPARTRGRPTPPVIH